MTVLILDVFIFQINIEQIHQENIQKVITEKDEERLKLKKSLETKINTLEDQLRNADHEKQTLIEKKVNMNLKKGLVQENKIVIIVRRYARNLQMS